MKRDPLPFYPLIVAAFPVVSIYSANLAYVPTSQVVRPLFVAILATAALVGLLGLALRSAARGAAVATVLVLAFFGYQAFLIMSSRFLGVGFVPPSALWTMTTVLVAALAAWKVRVAGPLNVLASFIGIVALANLGLGLARSASLAARAPRAALGEAAKGAKPDVFYIVLDGHGRSDAIRRAIGFDNASFIEGLRARGFYVAERSHSNYCQTELSLASSLNMEFVPNLLPKVGVETEDRTPLAGLIDDNEVARRMRAEGYRFVAVTSGFPPIRFTTADVRIGSAWGGSMIESTLIQMTPLATGSVIESQYDVRRGVLRDAFDNLGALGQTTPQPRFVIAHILAPHPPFVFGPHGERVARGKLFGFSDGDDYTAYVGSAEKYRNGYAGQVAWVELQTLAAIDRILAAEGPGHRPVIVVQGDHGSKLHLAQNSLTKTDLHECFPILNAYLVPDAVRKDLRPGITPVNSFRLILSDLFGEPLPQLVDRSWYSYYITPYAFTEVTDRIEPVTGHAAPPSP